MKFKALLPATLLLTMGVSVADNDPAPNYQLFWQGVDTLICDTTDLSSCLNSINIYTKTNAKCQQYGGWQWMNISSYGERIVEVTDLNWLSSDTQ